MAVERTKYLKENILSSLPEKYCYKKVASFPGAENCPDDKKYHYAPLNICYEPCEAAAKRYNQPDDKKFENLFGQCVESCDTEWP